MKEKFGDTVTVATMATADDELLHASTTSASPTTIWVMCTAASWTARTAARTAVAGEGSGRTARRPAFRIRTHQSLGVPRAALLLVADRPQAMRDRPAR